MSQINRLKQSQAGATGYKTLSEANGPTGKLAAANAHRIALPLLFILMFDHWADLENFFKASFRQSKLGML